VPFGQRGGRTDAALAELRRLLAEGTAAGGAMTVLPTSVRQPLPVLAGGGSHRALRRAVMLADGWDAPWKDAQPLAEAVEALAATCDAEGRDPRTLRLAVRAIPAERLDSAALEQYGSIGAGGIRVTDLGVHLPPVAAGEAADVLARLAERLGR
jgi:alkanesulfonate monooxygenase SsuD/methylene tetrahydromethanopterin reductase-like flavin-dependent oxidoreductase (luciferase family)